MKKIVSLLLIFVLIISVFSGCTSKEDGAPEGLQICHENQEGGYIFYAPENWTVVNGPEVSAAKVSAINSTSITFAEGEMPEVSIPEYFEASLKDFAESIRSSMKILTRDQKCIFGNSTGEAYKYVYTYKYGEYDVSCMQILLTEGDRFFIFTYTSYGDVEDEGSVYRSYLDKVQLAIESFKFTEKRENAQISYEKDEEGYNLVSDKTLTGFALYLPEEYEVIFSRGFVKAKISDQANISLSRATQTGIGIIDYLKIRRDDVSAFATEFTDLSIVVATEVSPESFESRGFTVAPTKDENLCFGDLDNRSVICYEYSFVMNGEDYHVYQLMGVDSRNGYVFTYTATEAEYEKNIDEVKKIIKKVRF